MARKNLFTSFDEIANFYPFQDTLQFSDLLSPLKSVERQFFTDVDKETWTKLLDMIDSETYLNDYWEELGYIASQAAAHLVAWQYMDKTNVIFSSAGLLVAKTEGTVPASEARTNALRYSLMKLAQTHLDEMLEHLEANTATFTDYAASPEREALNSLIIRTAAEFDQAYPISENRWIFRKLVTKQRMVIDTQLKAYVGQEFIDAYLDALDSGTMPDEYKAIRALMHRGIAHITFAEAVPSLQQQFGPEGIAIFDSSFQPAGSRRDSDDSNRFTLLQNTAMAQGLQELSKLKYYLNTHASSTVFPEYFASDSFVDPDIDDTDLNDYDDTPNHWAL